MFLKSNKFKVFTLTILSAAHIANAIAQCGHSAGLGCPNTDYSNFGLNSTNNPATIEYDNFVSSFHATAVRNMEGKLFIWGETTAGNGVYNLTTITEINSRYFGAIGNSTPLKIAMGGNYLSRNTTNNQAVLLTTDGLYAWGKTDIILPTSIINQTRINKLTIDGQTSGLPIGVAPTDVKMLFGTAGTLALVTCNGEAWVLSKQDGAMYGNGSSSTATNSYWNRVKINATTNLENVIALRGCQFAMMALTSDNKLYTWGTATYLGNSTTAQAINYATEMTLPTTNSNVKMIGMTLNGSSSTPSYYALMQNGSLYSLGNNIARQLGDFTNTERTTWVQPRYTNNGTVMDNVKWISPNEHDPTYAAINIINNEGRLWAWGNSTGGFLGTGTGAANNPRQPTASSPRTQNNNFIPTTSKVLAVETGGHTSMITTMCEPNFGYLGHATNGSAANTADQTYYSYTYSTAPVQICGAYSIPTVALEANKFTNNSGGVCGGQSIALIGTPAGGTYSITAGSNLATITNGNILNIQPGSGTVTVRYDIPTFECNPKYKDLTFTVYACDIYNVKGNIWLDNNADIAKNSFENGSNLKTTNNDAIWVNLVDNNGLVVSSAQVNADGSYTLPTTLSGTYSVSLSSAKVARGVAIPSGIQGLPSGWTATGTLNTNTQTTCTTSTCNTLISNIVVNSADVTGLNFGVKGLDTLTGNVFHDKNGITEATPTVDGLPLNTHYNGSNLFVALIDSDDKVINYAVVDINGNYSITTPVRENISLQLTTTEPVIGQSTTATLPANWVYVGESFGNNNQQGTGANTGTGRGANAPGTSQDGKIAVTFNSGTTNISQINFGIQTKPTADNKSYQIDNYTFSNVIPSGYPTVPNYPKVLLLSSSKLVDQNTQANGSLSGTDLEDCAITSSCHTGTNTTFEIKNINANTKLYYDFGGSVGIAEVIPNTPTAIINNFDYSKMLVYAATQSIETGFEYSMIDNAGLSSPTASYIITINEALPLTLLSFKATAADNKNDIKWQTANEIDVERYELLHSNDAKKWKTIYKVAPNNNNDFNQDYAYSHLNPNIGYNFYKLKMIDQDGTIAYSQVVLLNNNTTTTISISPNPVKDRLTINMGTIQLEDNSMLFIYDDIGRKVMEAHLPTKDQYTVDINHLTKGIYLLQITTPTNTYYNKFIKE